MTEPQPFNLSESLLSQALRINCFNVSYKVLVFLVFLVNSLMMIFSFPVQYSPTGPSEVVDLINDFHEGIYSPIEYNTEKLLAIDLAVAGTYCLALATSYLEYKFRTELLIFLLRKIILIIKTTNLFICHILAESFVHFCEHQFWLTPIPIILVVFQTVLIAYQ